jgi:hypothetical protein
MASPSVVRRNTGASAATASITSSFPSNTASNAIIVIAVAGTTTNTDWNVTPSDTKLNTYTAFKLIDDTAGTAQILIRGWYSLNIAATASTNTVTVVNANNDSALYVFEVNGLLTSSAFDQSVFTNATTASPTSGNTPTTTSANELVIGILGMATNQTVTLGAGYSNLQTVNELSASGGSEEQIVSSTGAYAANFTIGLSQATCMAVFTFAGPASATTSHNLTSLGVGN